MRVLERGGVDALSMRRVAEEIGTGAASLYGHIRDKDELLQLILERLTLGMGELPEPDPAQWEDQLKEFGRRIRAQMHEHRDMARISLGRVPSGQAIAVGTEWLFELMVPAGIPIWVAAFAGDLLALYVGAFAYEESLTPSLPFGEGVSPRQAAEMMKEYFRSLPEDQFPYLRGAVDAIFDTDRDKRFEFGLDVLVRGLASFAGGNSLVTSGDETSDIGAN